MAAYYNEIDPKAAAWLRELIKEKVIADGEVDTRSIADVEPADLAGFRACHFFAGIGGWSYALRLAGWPDDREVWTGSCPCQPFSVAGKSEGTGDPRHLWPAWFRLIAERRPATIFGEQVASRDGLYWLDLVYADLEASDYAIGAFDLPAAGVGAPHGRHRLWIVADTTSGGQRADGRTPWHAGHSDERVEVGDVGNAAGSRRKGHMGGQIRRGRDSAGTDAGATGSGAARGGLGDTGGARLEGLAGHGDDGHEPGRLGTLKAGSTSATGGDGILADADGGHANERAIQRHDRHGLGAEDARSTFWSGCDWLPCLDGKARPVESGTFPLVAGLPGDVVPSGDPSVSYVQATTEARVMRLRGYGNSIVPQVAVEVIAAYMEVR